MPIDPSQQLDPNQRRYSLPMDSCVGDDGPSPTEVTVISKGGARASAPGHLAPSGGDPYAGGKSASPGYKNPRVIVSGPDLPNDYDTDDPNRS